MTPERWHQIKHLVNSALHEESEARTALLQQSCADDFALRLGAEALLSATRQLPDAPLAPDQWQRIEKLFQSALELEPAKRAAFLAKACGDDEALRHEVESLLVYQGAAGGLIQDAVHEAAGLLPHDEKARFTPGTTLNKRYRILGLLGKGGMGEVYRADDLKLGQPVALKFLTEKLSQDKAMLARFHSEVAMAHRVTHPNVCRVHDIGEVTTSAGNLHFLSMEYVDGEDLSSLLRRIGRLPADKAVEIANQLCAGLAAAHEAGVLHRDLKPANVMIDGKGRVRITDFGLAGFAEQIKGSEVFAGTPAYMSPEQFAGKEVTTKSDIYALGLVLYEIFTGKRVFEAGSLEELKRMHESSAPTTPSSWVKDIDPLVERVIMRCLEKDPTKRLASAKQVADALPGGDPLAAVLAMGETPSPEMVAASGGKASLQPIVAVACLAAIVIGLLAAAWASSKVRLIHRVPFDNPPEVLAAKAREIAMQLGYTNKPADQVWDFAYNIDYLRYVEKEVPLQARWSQMKPQAILFRYRESPEYFQADHKGFTLEPSIYGYIPSSPFGMIEMGLDPSGRLIWFRLVPSPDDKSPSSSPDWATLLRVAGLEAARLTQVESQGTLPIIFDDRMSWTGTSADQPDMPLRIEAAAWHGKPIYFEIIYPWSKPSQFEFYGVAQLITTPQAIIILLTFITAMIVARWNYQRGRGDHRGAIKLACFLFMLLFLSDVLSVKYAPTTHWIVFSSLRAVARPMFFVVLTWLCYFAFEPFVRRYWPIILISWSRIMTGRIRDSLIGRDVLIGLISGIAIFLLSCLRASITNYLPETIFGAWHCLFSVLGARMAGCVFAVTVGDSVTATVAILFIFFLLRSLLRYQWLTALAFLLLSEFPKVILIKISTKSSLIRHSPCAVLRCESGT